MPSAVDLNELAWAPERAEHALGMVKRRKPVEVPVQQQHGDVHLARRRDRIDLVDSDLRLPLHLSERAPDLALRDEPGKPIAHHRFETRERGDGDDPLDARILGRGLDRDGCTERHARDDHAIDREEVDCPAHVLLLVVPERRVLAIRGAVRAAVVGEDVVPERHETLRDDDARVSVLVPAV